MTLPPHWLRRVTDGALRSKSVIHFLPNQFPLLGGAEVVVTDREDHSVHNTLSGILAQRVNQLLGEHPGIGRVDRHED